MSAVATDAAAPGPTGERSTTPVPPRRRRRNRYLLAPAALISVNVVLFLLFFVWPASIGIGYSFTDYTGIGDPEFVGLANYVELFQDPDFYAALTRTATYTVVAVPLNFVLGLGVASMMVSPWTRGKNVARVILFVPWLLSPIVTGVLWSWIFGENFGLVNFLLEQVGLAPLGWQSDANLSMLVVLLAGAWAGIAFNMLLFVAAMKNVPTSQYEAAELDGANYWQRFWYITLPGIAPTSFIVILLTTLGSIKEYALMQAVNNGGPAGANRLIVQYIYETGFGRARIGYASAASMVLMVILVAVALVQLAVNRSQEEKIR